MKKMVKDFKVVIKEVSDNYKKGSPAAKYAIENLNRFTVDTLSNMPLGQAIIEDKFTDSVLEDLHTRASGRTLSVIYNYLLIGSADYNEDGTTWYDRLKAIPCDKEYSNEFASSALEFVDSIYRTGKQVEAAKEFYKKLCDIRIENDDVFKSMWGLAYYALSDEEKADPKAVEEARRDTLALAEEEIGYDIVEADVLKEFERLSNLVVTEETDEETVKLCDEARGLMLYFFADTAMNEFEVMVANSEPDEEGNWAVPCGLGDSLWGWDEAAGVTFQSEWCYPTFEALTPAQRILTTFCGIECFLEVSFVNTEEKFAAQIEKVKADVKIRAEAEGLSDSDFTATLSVFWDFNPVFSQETIYLTDKAARSMASQTTASHMNAYEKGPQKAIFKAMTINSIVFGVIAIAEIGLGIYSFVTPTAVLGLSAWISATSSSFLLVFSGLVSLASYAALGAFVCILLVWLIYHIINQFSKRQHESMPRIMYDVVEDTENEREEKYIRYDLAMSPSGKEADMNGFVSERWLALYYSRDKSAGRPILADILRQEGNGQTPDGWSPVRMFGRRNAVNTNLHSKHDN